jgi:hypothetical protein
MSDRNLEMLAFETSCFIVEFALIVGWIALAIEGRTHWALAVGVVAVILGYAEGRFVGWARERYQQYFN